MSLDVLIKNGKIYDGIGNPWFRADIGVEEGKITSIGELKRISADVVIDASGLVVCPGFIDIHCHSDFQLILNPRMDSKVYQGVTTELNGNCGNSPSPLIGPDIKELRYYPVMKKLGVEPWSTTREYYRILEERGHATNTATLLGYANVRVPVIGLDNREPDERELDVMKALVAQGMEDGLFGLSTGLAYPPNSFAVTWELIELCRVVAEYGGTYVTHIRSEGKLFDEAIEEAITIGEESGVSVQCVHLKACGSIYWDKVPVTLSIIEKARKRGVDVTTDVYPYIRDSGNFSGWIPDWAHKGGAKELLKRLTDPETRENIKNEIADRESDPRSYLSTTILTRLNNHPELSGKKITDLSKAEKKDVIDYTLDLMVKEEGLGIGISTQFGSEENLKIILQHPASMVGSDGSGVSAEIEEWIHPRNFGTYPRVIRKYVREEGTLTLQEAIRKCTSFPAQRLGLKDRGIIREGTWADITIFDYKKIKDNFSLTKPNQYADGVEYVLVNGKIVLDEGRHTGKLPGKVLLRN